MRYVLGQALVVMMFHSPTRSSATFTLQCLMPAEPQKYLIKFFGMKTMVDSKLLSTLVVRLYLMMY